MREDINLIISGNESKCSINENPTSCWKLYMVNHKHVYLYNSAICTFLLHQDKTFPSILIKAHLSACHLEEIVPLVS